MWKRAEGLGAGQARASPCAWLPGCPGAPTLICWRAELVVAESVVVIKKLLQMQPAQHGEIIKHLAKLTDNIQVTG